MRESTLKCGHNEQNIMEKPKKPFGMPFKPERFTLLSFEKTRFCF